MSGATEGSSLAKQLIHKFCWGSFSPQQVQGLAFAAVQDLKLANPDFSLPDLEKLAQLGGSGQYPSRCNSELLAFLEPSVKLSPAFTASLPFKAPLLDQQQDFLLPHQVFADIYREYPDAFQQNLLNSEDELERFWEAAKGNPQYDDHPIRDRPNFSRKCIPIGMHGDDVPITGIGKGWTSKMTMFSWFSMVALGRNTKDKMHLIYAACLLRKAPSPARGSKYFAQFLPTSCLVPLVAMAWCLSRFRCGRKPVLHLKSTNFCSLVCQPQNTSCSSLFRVWFPENPCHRLNTLTPDL